MTPSELYDMMKKTQEPKGYFFNRDKDWVLSILADLLVNKDRYGYVLPLSFGGGRPGTRCRYYLPLPVSAR